MGKPIVEVADHLLVMREIVAETPSVTTCRIDIKRAVVASHLHGGIVGNAIGDGRYGAIVVGSQHQGRRREVTTNGTIAGELAHKSFIATAFAQEAHDRTAMGLTFVHRDNGIEQYGEIGACFERCMGADSRCQMATCREAHNAKVVGIDTPHEGTIANKAERFIGIAKRNIAVAIGHAILQHKKGNALGIEELCPIVSFVRHGKMAIAAAGTIDDSTA